MYEDDVEDGHFGGHAEAYRRSYAESGRSDIPLDVIKAEKTFYVAEERRSPTESDEEIATPKR
jgi:hypothetical protein